MRSTGRWLVGMLAATLAAAAGSLDAQQREGAADFTPRLGLAVQGAVLTGDPSGILDLGFGLAAAGTWGRGWSGRVGGRAEAGVLFLGGDAVAENLLFHGLVGPFFALEVGPVAPWIQPAVGFAATRWDRGPGPDPDDPGLDRTGSSGTWALGLDGGLALRLSPVALEAGLRVIQVGELTFARGSVVGPDAFSRNTAVLGFRLGVSFGL